MRTLSQIGSTMSFLLPALALLLGTIAHGEGGQNPGALAYMRTPEFSARMSELGFSRSDWDRNITGSHEDLQFLARHERKGATALSSQISPASGQTVNLEPTGNYQCNQIGGICFREFLDANRKVVLDSADCSTEFERFKTNAAVPGRTFVWKNDLPSGYRLCQSQSTNEDSTAQRQSLLADVDTSQVGTPYYGAASASTVPEHHRQTTGTSR